MVASSLDNGLQTETTLCPAVLNANVEVLTPAGLQTIHTEADPEVDTTNPTIAIQYIQERSQGQNENRLETDVLVAWERSVDRSDQVDGVVIKVEMDGTIGLAQQLIPETLASGVPLLNSDTVSHANGYAAKPELAASYFGSFLAWMDDDTVDGNNDSSLFLLSRYRNETPGPYVISEFEQNDASGRGLSRSGGSLQSLSLGLPEYGFASTLPYMVWTEAGMQTPGSGDSPLQSVYLRVTQQGLALLDDFSTGGKFRPQGLNALANDVNLFGEGDGRVVMIDGRPLEGQSIEFISPLGATVKASPDGTLLYDPRGVPGFLALKRGVQRTESFVYQVDNFIHQAEAIVGFTVIGRNRWHNVINPFDVTNDGKTDPLDVLRIVNDLNSNGTRELSQEDDETTPPAYFDVDDDGTVSPLDVLRLVNRINGAGNGEGESGNPFDMEVSSPLSPIGRKSYRIRNDAIDSMLAAASAESLWEEITKRKESRIRN